MGKKKENQEEEAIFGLGLAVSDGECARVDGLSKAIRPHRAGEASFFEGFALRGIRVDGLQPGLLSCSFTVPPRLTDSSGHLAAGAVVSLVDELGAAAAISDGHHLKVSVDMSISFISPAKLNDELEMTSRVVGHKGGYSGTHVIMRNKATGEVVAEGRHSLFGKMKSRM